MSQEEQLRSLELCCTQRLERPSGAELCGEPTLWIGFWGGSGSALSLCERHYRWLLSVGDAMGVMPVTAPFLPQHREAVLLRMAKDAEERLLGG